MAEKRWAGRAVGRVQGVGFRAFVEQTARKAGFTGWVKNMPDGSVVMEAQGEEALFSEFEKRIRAGNEWIRVEHMFFEHQKNTEGETDFEIRK